MYALSIWTNSPIRAIIMPVLFVRIANLLYERIVGVRAVDIIAKKRDGLPLTTEEINFFINGFTRGQIPDYQAAAWLMAVTLRGMDARETRDLTLAMALSGETLDLSQVAPVVADKHSTGGVGDKTTLVLGPIVAAAGLPIGKISGRALGFSGGTLDKLESVPGFRAELTVEEFITQVRQVGLVVAGQTADLVPADRKLYALRDVTATVQSLPLIASSIMSKKIAGGAHVILLDVKVGRGAFMKSEDEAIVLAEAMVDIGKGLGRRVAAVVSDMNQPLGRAVGNAVELREAIETLRGGGPADLRHHCITLGSQLLMLARRASSEDEARAMLEETIRSGQAFAKLRALIAAQGGDPTYVDHPERLPTARFIEEVPAPRAGWVAGVDALEVAMTTVDLGAGRARKEDRINYAVGVVLGAKAGDRVEAGQPLFTVHADDREKLVAARERVLAAYSWSDEPVSSPPLIHRIIT